MAHFKNITLGSTSLSLSLDFNEAKIRKGIATKEEVNKRDLALREISQTFGMDYNVLREVNETYTVSKIADSFSNISPENFVLAKTSPERFIKAANLENKTIDIDKFEQPAPFIEPSPDQEEPEEYQPSNEIDDFYYGFIVDWFIDYGLDKNTAIEFMNRFSTLELVKAIEQINVLGLTLPILARYAWEKIYYNYLEDESSLVISVAFDLWTIAHYSES